MEKFKISVITVVKNGMPYLPVSIKSFELQEYENKELIIVYAPSNDGTEEYLEKCKYKNIKIIKDEKSKTKFGSINLGINNSTGDFFCLLHSDDIFFKEKTLNEISKNFDNDINLIYGDVIFSKKNDLTTIVRKWKSKNFDKKNLNYGWMPPHTSIFLNRNYYVYKNNVYTEEFPISGDYNFILEIFSDPKIKVKYVNQTVTLMRSGGDSTNLKNIYRKIFEDLNIAKKFYKHYFLCVILKILQKIFQIKLLNSKIESNYVRELNAFKIE